MIDRTTKLRWRRLIKQHKRQVEDIGTQAEDNLEQHFFKRLSKLGRVRRFVISWLLLIGLLIGGLAFQSSFLKNHYLTSQPVPGGIFIEGILGVFTNANPVYATGSADSAVAKLVFAGLMKYDTNNQLSYDLAEKWEVDPSGKVYTVTLRPNLVWHDGEPLTADDVVFTYQLIQNPDAKSPLRINWQGVIVEQQGKHTIVFTLPNALSAFPHSLTNGIVPKHVLGEVKPAQMRSSRFNTVNPIGSGPFKWGTIEVIGNRPSEREEQIGLVPFENYHRGAPKLQKLVLRVFRDEQKLIESFKKQELIAITGLENIDDDLKKLASVQEHNIPLTSQVAVFFKTTQPPFDDINVRQALVQATDIIELISGLDYPVIVSRSPFLPYHIGYDKDLTQFALNRENAIKLLDEAGWVLQEETGIRSKDEKKLSFRLYSQSTAEYSNVARQLQRQWGSIGIDAQVILQNANDLQTTVSQHAYDALLYGISLGGDPDVFAYWHSNQATARSGSWLNLSEYQSGGADQALEAGRTRDDAELRAVKYKQFLEAWRNDAPALTLYQPRFLYITRGKIHNFQPKFFNQASDRFNNVEQWMIREAKTLHE